MVTTSATEPEKKKTLAVTIPSHLLGPNDVPVFYGALDSPVIIRGRVSFSTNYDCKGGDILIEYTARCDVSWSERRNKKTYRYRSMMPFDERKYSLVVPHPTEKTVQAGNYFTDFEIPLDPTWPSSSQGPSGKMTYKVKATLARAFPSTDIVTEQLIWVVNTVLPRAPPPPVTDLPMPMTMFSGVFEGQIPYDCVIPSPTLFLGQSVPILLKMHPVQVDLPPEQKTGLFGRLQKPEDFRGCAVQVEGGLIKLKQYTFLKAGQHERLEKKDLVVIKADDGWPHAEVDKIWKRIVVMQFPDTMMANTGSDCPVMVTQHKLKLILKVRIGSFKPKELRIEMPIVLTGTRPPGEPYPSFEFQRYMGRIEKL